MFQRIKNWFRKGGAALGMTETLGSVLDHPKINGDPKEYTRIDSSLIDGKVVAQQTQINQLSDKIELVVKEQTELNTKYSKIEQTTDAIRSEVVEIGQAVADIGTYVNYLINADDFSDNLPYTIGMPGPPQVGLIGLEGTVMNKGTLKLYQRYNGDRFYSITDQNSSIPKDEDVTFSGHYKQLTLPCSIKLTVNRVTTKTLNLSGEQDFEFTFKIPKGATSYSLELAATGEARQESYFSKMKLNKGSKRVENTVDTASLNARISTVEQTANGLKTEVKDIQIDNGVMDGRISTVEQTANGLKTEVALIKDDQIVQSSQITQLSDNINLRVEKNKVVAQINISPETIRIQAKFIHLNGTSLIDNAVIKTAHIADLSVTGAKIQDASIANAKIINLDVDKISGNTTNFVQSNWNSISKSVSINANGLLISDSWQNAVSTIDSKGMTLHHNGIEVGTFMTGENQGDKTLHIQLMPKGKHIYIGHSHSDGTYGSFMTLKRGEKSANASYLRQSRITFFGHTEFLDSIVPFGWSGSTQDVPIRIGTTIGVNHKTGVLNDDLTSGITFSSGNAYLYHNFKEISFSQIFSKLGL
ncbi:hypothetical protein ACODH8_09955 [Vagococcus fluvialis]|uniref:hypothetical protein n=1 Tax=Vagococcus fluvialis TaxID=2738 RepID=UPI003B59F5DB